MAESYEQFESGEIEIRVRYPEADQMGVLHHSRYWIYFEMGRTELLRATGLTYRDIEASGVFLVLSKCSCKYIASAFYDDVLTLKTTITKMGAARIDHAYELRRKDDGTLIATAETTLACVDRDGKVQPLPDSIRQYNQE
jgi:acyl-CoA thioester hydrolase